MRYLLFAVTLATVAAHPRLQSPGGPRVEGRAVCYPYSAAEVGLKPLQDGTWQMAAGGMVLRVFADREDAEAGVEVARSHSQVCYIGRDNTRPEPDLFVMEYWK